MCWWLMPLSEGLLLTIALPVTDTYKEITKITKCWCCISSLFSLSSFSIFSLISSLHSLGLIPPYSVSAAPKGLWLTDSVHLDSRCPASNFDSAIGMSRIHPHCFMSQIFHPWKKCHSCQIPVLPEMGPQWNVSAQQLDIRERKEPQKQKVLFVCVLGLDFLF